MWSTRKPRLCVVKVFGLRKRKRMRVVSTVTCFEHQKENRAD